MTENREKAIKRTKNLAYWFMGEMLKEEERGEKEKEAFEKAKEAEKAETKAASKGGIHGRLEKAKAEIKAKEEDKVPKNKSKDLATAL